MALIAGFSYLITGFGACRGRPWPPTRPVKMRVHSYASTRRCVLLESTHKGRCILSSRAKPGSRQQLNRRGVPRTEPFGRISWLQLRISIIFHSCEQNFIRSNKRRISADRTPFCFTPTHLLACLTRRASSYHEAAPQYISPFLAPRPTFSQTSAIYRRCLVSAPFSCMPFKPKLKRTRHVCIVHLVAPINLSNDRGKSIRSSDGNG